MAASLVIRRVSMGAAGVLAALMLGVAVLGVAVESGHFRASLIGYAASRAGRPVTVDGALEVRILTLHPRVMAERITIGNPPWMPQGTLATIEKLTVAVTLPWFGRAFAIEKLDMEGASLRLARDAAGRANWRMRAPGNRSGDGPPIIRALSMLNAHVELDDARRHLQFQGTVSAHDVEAAGALRPLRIEGAGQLNGRAATFSIDGAPLATANRATPYRFTFAENSSGSRLMGSGFLAIPFNPNVLDASFEAVGADLKDLYFLAGVTLVHTGSYHLSGHFSRRGRIFRYTDLVVNSGQSRHARRCVD